VDFVAADPKPWIQTRGRDKLALGRAVQRAGQYRGRGGEVGRQPGMVDREREGRGSWPGQCPELSRKGIAKERGRKGEEGDGWRLW
jgi:hypothetical protein